MADRFQIRTSADKLEPGPDDLLPGELGYTLANKNLYFRHPVTGTPVKIAGEAVVETIEAINKLPIIQAALQAMADSEASRSGNVLTLMGATDPDGDTVTVASLSYASVNRAVNTTFQTTYGSLNISANGAFVFQPNATARALTVGQTGSIVVLITVTDSRGALVTRPFTFNISGTNGEPVLSPDVGSAPAGSSMSGNVLTNDIDPEGTPLTLVSFSINGTSGVLGQNTSIPSFGTFALNVNGGWSFTPLNGSVSGTVIVDCQITDGVNTRPSTLELRVAPPAASPSELLTFLANVATQPDPARIAPNPVTGRAAIDRTVTPTYVGWDYRLPLPSQTGRPADALDFRVGPGREYTTPGQIPWEELQAGDRVFIEWRATPYNDIISLNVRGREDAWIQILGVPNPSTGALPMWSGQNAVSNPAHTYTTFVEGNGLFICVPGEAAANNWKPGYIHIHGFEFIGVKATTTYTNRLGQTVPWDIFTPALYAKGVDYMTVTGCDLHGNEQGLFVNSGADERFQSRYIHVFGNYFHDNSSVGSFSEHNAYTEAAGVIYELNYFGSIVPGSHADCIKERSCGQVFRYNYIEGGSNLISLRDPSPTNQGGNGDYQKELLDGFGDKMIASTFIYGNIFLAKGHIPDSFIAHGDGVNGDLRYGTVYFYNNVVLQIHDAQVADIGGVNYNPERTPLFGMLNTRSPATIDARNNLFYSASLTPGGTPARFGIFYWQGLANFQSNWISSFSPVAYETAISNSLSKGTKYAGAGLGGLTASVDNPQFTNIPFGDYSLLQSSPFYALTAPVPPYAVARGLVPTRGPVLYPFNKLPKPVLKASPVISGGAVEGSTVTVGSYVFSPVPTSYRFTYYVNGVSNSVSSSNTFNTAGLAGTSLTVGVVAINESGESAEALSQAFSITSASAPVNTTAPVITGSGQVTFEHSVDTGVWTNSPVSYSYRVYLNSVAVSDANGGNLPNFTPAANDDGKTLGWMVTATEAGGQTAFVMSNTITLGPVSLDPDATRRWNFAAANDTSLDSLGLKWNGALAPYGYGYGDTHFTCQNGSVECTHPYGLYNRTRAWLEDGQGDNVAVEASIEFSAGTLPDRGLMLALRQTETQYYAVAIRSTGLSVTRNEAIVASPGEMSFTSPAVVKVVPNGGELQIYVNGTLQHTYTDASPLVGGYPGICSYKDGDEANAGKMNWWTDNPIV